MTSILYYLRDILFTFNKGYPSTKAQNVSFATGIALVLFYIYPLAPLDLFENAHPSLKHDL